MTSARHRPVNPRSPLHAEVLLVSLPGAVGFLRDDLASLPPVTVLRTGADYLVARVDGPIGDLLDLRTYSSLGVLLSRTQDGPDLVTQRLGAVAHQLAELVASPGPLRYRVDASVPDRQRVIESVHQHLGWDNDPSRWHLNLAVHHGQVVAQIGAMFLTERLGALVRLPASTTPIIAEVMVRLAKLPPGATVLDCFCGAGTILVTAHAGRHRGDVHLVGFDRDRQALAAARGNLQQAGAPATLARAQAERLPLAELSIDRIVSNLPFGKRVGSHRDNEALYPSFLREAERVLSPGGRMVLLTEDKALLRRTVQRTHRIKVIREVLLRSGGGTPTAFVIERNRRPRQRSSGGSNPGSWVSTPVTGRSSRR